MNGCSSLSPCGCVWSGLGTPCGQCILSALEQSSIDESIDQMVTSLTDGDCEEPLFSDEYKRAWLQDELTDDEARSELYEDASDEAEAVRAEALSCSSDSGSEDSGSVSEDSGVDVSRSKRRRSACG